jgi:hypothetical protein
VPSWLSTLFGQDLSKGRISVGLSTILGIVASLAGWITSAITQATDGNPLGLTPAQLAGLATAVAVITQVGRYSQAVAGILKGPGESAEPAKQATGAGSSATITLPVTFTPARD